jgi:hypothetical protein
MLEDKHGPSFSLEQQSLLRSQLIYFVHTEMHLLSKQKGSMVFISNNVH